MNKKLPFDPVRFQEEISLFYNKPQFNLEGDFLWFYHQLPLQIDFAEYL